MAERSMKPVRVEDALLEEFKKLPVATIWGVVHTTLGVPFPFMENVNLMFAPGGKRLAARARTLRYHPMRVDLINEVRDDENSPEYRAMGRCGPGDVLVCYMMGNTDACVFGDVKALQLKMNNADGIVTFAGRQRGYGRVVKIRHAFGFETVYAHLNRARVKVGQRVGRGDRIGDMGSTGRSTGNHVHYEIRIDNKPVNPVKFIEAARDVL